MTWMPPPVIGLAIIAGIVIPILLIGLSWGPRALRRPARRLKASFAFAWLVWLGAGAVLSLTNGPAPFADWLAGAALLIAAMLTAYVIWSMLVWGFTVNLLCELAKAATPVDRAGWANAYSGGRSEHQICRDRLGVLIAFGLAQGRDDRYVLAPIAGRAVASAYRIARGVFGLPS